MKVKEYLVSEILELKHNIRKLQEDIAKRDTMISEQHNRIERFEKREREFKEHNNQIYGKLCEVRQIISDNMLQELPDYRPVRLSIKGEGGTDSEKADFDKLLELLDLKEDQMKDNDNKEAPDEIPED